MRGSEPERLARADSPPVAGAPSRVGPNTPSLLQPPSNSSHLPLLTPAQGAALVAEVAAAPSKLPSVLEQLLALEKTQRLAADIAGTKKFAVAIARACRAAGAWKVQGRVGWSGRGWPLVV